MIINASGRCDIPAYFSQWFMNRIRSGYVMARNPYNPSAVSRYILSPELVDCIVFCTKNPLPMLRYINELKRFHLYFFITITPYGRDIEPGVPDKSRIMKAVCDLSDMLGRHNVCWRYDPIFITEKYSVEYHIRAFGKMAEVMGRYIDECVISFIDMYAKTRRNFPQAKEVTAAEKELITENLARIAGENGFAVKTCAENGDFTRYGIKSGSCMAKETIEKAVGVKLFDMKNDNARPYCGCMPSRDIGEYNACMHGCKYCYANYDMKIAEDNFKKHDVNSPLLIGNIREDDVITNSAQKSFINNQLELEW